MKKNDTAFWALAVSFVFAPPWHWPVWLKLITVLLSGTVLVQVSNRLFSGFWKAGVTMGGKYESQQKYNRKTYVRFPLDLKPDVLAAFRAACEKNETTPTTEIKKFIADYIDKNKRGVIPRLLFLSSYHRFFEKTSAFFPLFFLIRNL